ncbi:Shikimate kinase/gluconokinase [Dillenia turbinata]|uniref:Shikimate kinase/gluconokinase n=1 Tax=Dillenia turbinata TaxID=194707 RepID=A0AAN8Z1G4_9MAGN
MLFVDVGTSEWYGSYKIGKRPCGSLSFSQKCQESQKVQMLVTFRVQPRSTRQGSVASGNAYSYEKFPASMLGKGSFSNPSDDALIVKNKSQEVVPYLDGRCIYLVGMMGSGKTTVGRILSDVLSYSFIDSDNLVEENVGTSVAHIFQFYVLRKLSIMHRIVVATGGGAVIRPINWKYMRKGISVWLDVPVETLAQRITDVGVQSRPLLHQEPGDAYSKTFRRLSALLEERGEAYANADARVSLESIAAKLGHRDISNLTPTIVAIEALEQIRRFLNGEGGMELEFGIDAMFLFLNIGISSSFA